MEDALDFLSGRPVTQVQLDHIISLPVGNYYQVSSPRILEQILNYCNFAVGNLKTNPVYKTYWFWEFFSRTNLHIEEHNVLNLRIEVYAVYTNVKNHKLRIPVYSKGFSWHDRNSAVSVYSFNRFILDLDAAIMCDLFMNQAFGINIRLKDYVSMEGMTTDEHQFITIKQYIDKYYA